MKILYVHIYMDNFYYKYLKYKKKYLELKTELDGGIADVYNNNNTFEQIINNKLDDIDNESFKKFENFDKIVKLLNINDYYEYHGIKYKFLDHTPIYTIKDNILYISLNTLSDMNHPNGCKENFRNESENIKDIHSKQTKSDYNPKKLILSSDGFKLYLINDNNIIILNKKDEDNKDTIDLSNGKNVNNIESVVLSPDNNFLFIGSNNNIIIVNLNTKTFGYYKDNNVLSLAISSDGKNLYSGSNGVINILNFDESNNNIKLKLKLSKTITLPNLPNTTINYSHVIPSSKKQKIYSLVLSSDNNNLYVGCEDGSVRIIDLNISDQNAQIIFTTSNNTSITSLVLSSNNTNLYAVDEGGDLHIFDLSTDTSFSISSGATDLSSIILSFDNSKLYITSKNNILIYDLSKKDFIKNKKDNLILHNHISKITSTILTPNVGGERGGGEGEELVSCSKENFLISPVYEFIQNIDKMLYYICGKSADTNQIFTNYREKKCIYITQLFASIINDSGIDKYVICLNESNLYLQEYITKNLHNKLSKPSNIAIGSSFPQNIFTFNINDNNKIMNLIDERKIEEEKSTTESKLKVEKINNDIKKIITNIYNEQQFNLGINDSDTNNSYYSIITNKFENFITKQILKPVFPQLKFDNNLFFIRIDGVYCEDLNVFCMHSQSNMFVQQLFKFLHNNNDIIEPIQIYNYPNKEKPIIKELEQYVLEPFININNLNNFKKENIKYSTKIKYEIELKKFIICGDLNQDYNTKFNVDEIFNNNKHTNSMKLIKNYDNNNIIKITLNDIFEKYKRIKLLAKHRIDYIIEINNDDNDNNVRDEINEEKRNNTIIDDNEKKRLADEAREAEKKRLADVAENKRLADEAREAEKKRLADEAREAENKRLANDPNNKRLDGDDRTKIVQNRDRCKKITIETDCKKDKQCTWEEWYGSYKCLGDDNAVKKRLADEAVDAEKKRLADEVAKAEKKRLSDEAGKAENKRLADLAEKKRLADVAEKKRLADEAEKKRLADEAGKAENKRLADLAEKKRLADDPNKNIKKNRERCKKITTEINCTKDKDCKWDRWDGKFKCLGKD